MQRHGMVKRQQKTDRRSVSHLICRSRNIRSRACNLGGHTTLAPPHSHLLPMCTPRGGGREGTGTTHKTRTMFAQLYLVEGKRGKQQRKPYSCPRITRHFFLQDVLPTFGSRSCKKGITRKEMISSRITNRKHKQVLLKRNGKENSKRRY
jgi:hypothetical protein